MKTEEIDYLNKFESSMTDALLKLCTSFGALDGTLLESDDINDRWFELAPEYMVDAVPQIADYPTVSVAWAAYLGLAIAQGWDTHWETTKMAEYKSYYGEQGFDDMDDHIVRDVLGLKLTSPEAEKLNEVIRSCAEMAVNMIRHEQIDPATEMAFHAFARACKAMFKIGEAIELKRLGYKFEQIGINENLN